MENRISGTTGLLALIGSPVGHSGSPAMYNYSFQKLGLDYVYVAFDVQEEEVKRAIEAIRTFKMRGCNVTMPDKTEAAKYMDELSDAARLIGAVNTIVNDNGRLTGYITDYSTSLMTLLFFELIIATIGTIATLTWIGLGVLLRKAYQKYYRTINIVLALTLLKCVYSMLK